MDLARLNHCVEKAADDKLPSIKGEKLCRALKHLAGVTWELLDWTVEFEDGTKVQPWGTNFIGRILYTRDGSIMTNIMQTGRPNFVDSTGPFDGTEAERAAAYLTDVAYGGDYVITEYDKCLRKGIVYHYITQSWYPNWYGTVQKRYFEIVDGKLVITTDFGSIIPGQQPNRQILTWEKKDN